MKSRSTTGEKVNNKSAGIILNKKHIGIAKQHIEISENPNACPRFNIFSEGFCPMGTCIKMGTSPHSFLYFLNSFP